MRDAPHILVTGGAGYIGAHACKQLARSGYVPVSFDNLSTGWASAVKFGPLVEGDLLNKAAVKVAFDTYQPVAVMHFAALSQVGEATCDPGLYWRNNLVGLTCPQ
jgi:UDP-glucose 4-epimerase